MSLKCIYEIYFFIYIKFAKQKYIYYKIYVCMYVCMLLFNLGLELIVITEATNKNNILYNFKLISEIQENK